MISIKEMCIEHISIFGNNVNVLFVCVSNNPRKRSIGLKTFQPRCLNLRAIVDHRATDEI